MDNMKVSLFQNLQTPTSVLRDLGEILRLIRHDNSVKWNTEAYRKKAAALGKAVADDTVKKALLPAFSVAVWFDGAGKKIDHAKEYTGLVICDIDHINDVDLVFQKVKADPHTLLAYRTVSGEGLRVIARYEPLSHAAFPAAYLAVNTYYAKLAGCAYDNQCGDPERLSGIAHDPEGYLNEEAEPFTISDEQILEANILAHNQKGKPRKQYDPGSQSTTVEEAWPKIQMTLSRRKLVYAPHFHHIYVLHASFLFNRFGVDLDSLIDWAEQEWNDYDKKERERTIRSCYKKTEEHGIWKLNERKNRETAMITLDEIALYLREHYEFIYNEITDFTMVRLANRDTLTIRQEWKQLDDRVLCTIRHRMGIDTGKRVLKNDVLDMIRSTDITKQLHPVRDYIDRLPKWDGIDRIAELASCLTIEPVQQGQTQEEAQRDFLWAFHKWWAATVLTWLRDDKVNQEVLVLIGKQGIYKTTFFRQLLPPELRTYYWENGHNTFSSKDDHLALAENCIVEIEEIEQSTNNREIAELKQLITSVTVKERRPYARFREQKHRLASFCATGNEEQFLSDETGNRRWLCFKVSHIDNPFEWNLKYEQIYAQLRDEILSGFSCFFTSEEEQWIGRQCKPFTIVSDELGLVIPRFRPPRPGESYKLMNASMVWVALGGKTCGISSNKIGKILNKLGFQMKHTRNGNFYMVVEIPITEQQAYITSRISDDKENQAQEKASPSPFEQDLPF